MGFFRVCSNFPEKFLRREILHERRGVTPLKGSSQLTPTVSVGIFIDCIVLTTHVGMSIVRYDIM